MIDISIIFIVVLVLLSSCRDAAIHTSCYDRPATQIRHGVYQCNCVSKTVHIKRGDVREILMEACGEYR